MNSTIRSRVTSAWLTAKFFLWAGSTCAMLAYFTPRMLFVATDSLVQWAAESGFRRVVALVVVVGFGVLMYLLRTVARARYAVLEINVAIIAMWFALGAVRSSPATNFGAIFAAVYVFIRGLDNFNQGCREKLGKDWALRFWASMRHGVPFEANEIHITKTDQSR